MAHVVNQNDILFKYLEKGFFPFALKFQQNFWHPKNLLSKKAFTNFYDYVTFQPK